MPDKRIHPSIVLLMVAIAVILAAVVFLAINVIQNRNREAETDLAASNFLVTVGAEQVLLQVDPHSRPIIVEAPVTDDTPRTEDAPDQQVQEATATPEPTAVPVDTQVATAVPAAPTIAKIIFLDYLVQQGDTLYSISQRIDTSIALMADNGIAQDHLVPGQTIRLPIGNPEFCTGRGRPYAVGEGDTAYNLSKRFNTTPQNLQSINQLDGNFTVKIADIICVP
jgi:LysM repeat protein